MRCAHDCRVAFRRASRCALGYGAARRSGGPEKPAGLARTAFWVPHVEQPGHLPTMFTAVPEIQVIQLTGAHVETFVGQVPQGMTRCDARGVHGIGELPPLGT